MNIVPLQEFVALRRASEQGRNPRYWSRDARDGKIPGAFQYQDNGAWFVDLDIHDDVVRNRAAGHKSTTPAPDIIRLARAIGLNDDDLQAALEAAGA